MRAALLVEWWKLRRSPVTVTATLLMAVVLPVLGLGFYTVGMRGGTGATGAKAQALLIGEGWVGYVGAVDQIAAAAMFVGAGVVVAWMFGREHADRTFPALFALPVSRATIAVAKFVVLAAWAVTLSLSVAAVTAAIGLAGGVEPFVVSVHGPEILRVVVVALSTTMLALPVGWAASIGRGYLPAIGLIVLVLMAAQVAVLFGTGGWFPFAVPGLVAVAASGQVPAVTAAQFALVPVAVLVGVVATVRWWARAEVV